MTLPPEVVAPMLREIAKRGVYAHIFTGDGEVVTPAEKYPGVTSSKIVHVKDVALYVLETGALARKVTCKGPADQIPGIRDWLRSNWGDTVAVSQTGPSSAEAMPAGCSKHRGLTLIMDMLGLDARDAMAIGDAENDAELLTAVGFPVAMGNATPEVKKIAAYITASNSNCGVAKAIAHFREAGFLGGRDGGV
jgi:hydroxymethylpyrimidine pyrophosphatase-like HAD family hydrolase